MLTEIWGKPPHKDKIYQGVIAQELLEIAPDMVREIEMPVADKEGNIIRTEQVLEVDPNKFTYALINAVKELSATSEQQQKIIEELKAENENKVSVEEFEKLKSDFLEFKRREGQFFNKK